MSTGARTRRGGRRRGARKGDAAARKELARATGRARMCRRHGDVEAGKVVRACATGNGPCGVADGTWWTVVMVFASNRENLAVSHPTS
jgi:hypothetical protein